MIIHIFYILKTTKKQTGLLPDISVYEHFIRLEILVDNLIDIQLSCQYKFSYKR